jgi:hypothetical protein
VITVARRIARLELEVLVTHRQVALYDDGGDQAVPDLSDTSRWLFVGDNVVLAVSTGLSDHPATVAVEAWDEAPDPEAGWEVRADGRLRLDSGDLELKPGEPPPHTQLLRVGAPGGYHVRGYTRGRAAIAGMPPGPALFEQTGVEYFLFQFWPAADNPGWA